MPGRGNITGNVTTEWVDVYGHTIIKTMGAFGGGTVALERRDAEGVALTLETSLVPKTWYIDVKPMQVRLSLSGATLPNLEWQIL